MSASTFHDAIVGGAKVVASKDQVSADLSGEAAILSLKSGVYYGLDSVGARIWTLLQTPKCVAEIRDTITSEYDVDAERSERDVVRLLEQLAKEGLVELHVPAPAQV